MLLERAAECLAGSAEEQGRDSRGAHYLAGRLPGHGAEGAPGRRGCRTFRPCRSLACAEARPAQAPFQEHKLGALAGVLVSTSGGGRKEDKIRAQKLVEGLGGPLLCGPHAAVHALGAGGGPHARVPEGEVRRRCTACGRAIARGRTLTHAHARLWKWRVSGM